jgi:hypothetical protein
MTDAPARPTPFYCSDCSREVGEQLFATAPRTDVWLLLEYTGPWNAKALPESDLPDHIKAHLNGWTETIPNAKFAFIKRERATPGVAFFVALSRENDPALYAFRLEHYDDLLKLDVPALATGARVYAEHRRHESLFAVCTNGRRDVSCSKYGVPIYRELEAAVGEAAWQVTHIGGHRFAATFACLPHGLVYGFIDPGDVQDVVESYRSGQQVLSKARGMSYYDAPAQAADYFLRQSLGVFEIGALRLVGVQPDGNETWNVRLAVGDKTYVVRVARYMSVWKTYLNSGDADPQAVPQFRLEGCEEAG